MKKILIIISLCCGAILLSAQGQFIPIDTDVPESFSKNLDAYVGTWEYRAGADVFRIVLKKDKDYHDYDGTYLNERIYGGHVYVRDGEVVSDCIQIVEESTTFDYKIMSISANNAELDEENVDPNELRLAFRDRIKNKRGMGTLTLIPGTPAQLHWKIMREPEGVVLLKPGEELRERDPTWSVPKDVILTKVE
ncbi:MAG: hypothetical protein LBF69_06390 [Prevotellaceae bacterium]|jgi:hypothetical protein|nr:hypothetical protein [Prevotellaceae bacterium]